MKDLREEIKDIMHDILSGYNARHEAKYDIIDTKLDGINNRLDKLNSKVAQHEDKLINIAINDAKRSNTCPNKEDIINLKDESKTRKMVNRIIMSSLVACNLILGIIIALDKLQIL